MQVCKRFCGGTNHPDGCKHIFSSIGLMLRIKCLTINTAINIWQMRI